MRDLRYKFRAWLKNTKEIVEVTDVNFYEKTISYIIDDYANITQIWEDSEFEEVELMQFTGLKDKNGIEIYEGDILQASDLFNGVIEYHPTRAQYVGRNVGKSYQGDVFDTLYTSDGVFRFSKVIGNIYENKELLEEN